MKKVLFFIAFALILILQSNKSNSQIVISGYMANPSGNDSAFEYVQLVATQNINFATTPYSVVVCNNGTALSKGWATGAAITYGYNLSSGSVVTGQTFYVGGSSKRINGTGSTDISSTATWIRTINNNTTGGDSLLGNVNPLGVFGNGGTSADGIAVFTGFTNAIDSAKVPVDAIFYGTAVGGAKPTTGGYMLPNNDRYLTAQGTFGNGTNTYMFTDVSTSGLFIQMTGTWNTFTNTWSVNRTSASKALTSTSALTTIASQITLYGLNPVADTVKTTSATYVTMNSAILNGNVTYDGNTPIISRGFCYDTVVAPDTSKSKVIVSGTTGIYSGNISGLLAGKTYHFKAFAMNSVGLSYGGDSTFTTLASAIAPTATTGTSTTINDNSAVASGNVISDGGDLITARGICYDTLVNPTITGNHTLVSGTTGTFTSALSGLKANTTYHVRAYATNSVNTSYGADSTFKTLQYVPTYAVANVRGVNATTGVADSLNVNCKLIGVVHGLNYATTGYNFFLLEGTTGINVYKTTTLTSYPTVAEGDLIKVIGKTQQTNGLIQIVPDSIVKMSVNNILYLPTSATVLDESFESRLVKIDSLTYISGWPTTAGTTKTVLAKHNNDSTTIIIYSGCNLQGTPAPTVTFNIVGLVNQVDATNPYLQGYQLYPRRTADLTYNYSNPVIFTNAASNINPTKATCSGNITSDGGYTITTRGICIDTAANPDTSKTKTIVTGTTGTYSATFTNLALGTTYHFRAYVINSLGIFYGGDSTFTTKATPDAPQVSTGTVTSIGAFNATVSGSITYNGGANITAKGICYSTTSSPNISGLHTTDTTSTTTISSVLTNLASSTHYWVRAYATNSAGTEYGDTVSFNTLLNIPTYQIAQVKHADTLGVADSNNVNCKLVGVVNSINYTATGYQFYILDQNNGIWVYRSAALANYTTVAKGDSLKVIGKITMNSAAAYGMISIVPDSLVKLGSGAPLQQPLVINQLTSDTLESRLVKMTNLYYLSGWYNGLNQNQLALARHGNDTIQIRITTTCNLFATTPPPTTVPFAITGFVLQASANTVTPYVGGYRIYPRDTSDLQISYAAPFVSTGVTTGITQFSAVCAGNVTSDGGKTIITRGICYDTLAAPDTSKAKMIITGTTGAYSANLSNLIKGKTYHYRAYAINSIGLTYGGDSVFTTAANPVIAVVTTGTASSITENSAVVSGTIVNDGGDTVFAKGICWSTTNNPTIANAHTTDTSSLTPIVGNLTGLLSSTKYYARAYATTSAGTGYGDTISFTTLLSIPTYTLNQIKGVNAQGTADSLNVNCKLIGVVNSINYSTNGYQFNILDNTNGVFVYRATALTGYTTVARGDSLRIIGKIIQNPGNANNLYYGTIAIAPDSIVKIASGAALKTATLVSSINNDSLESKLVKLTNLNYLSGWTGTGTRTVYAMHGVDTVIIRIGTNCNIYNVAAPTATVNFSMAGFVLQQSSNTTAPYSGGYRLYPRDTNDYTVSYTNPVVQTIGSTGITMTSAICNGNIPTDGGYAISARGMAYDTLVNPIATGTHLVVTGTTGAYAANLSSLIPGKTYHYRAYATNTLGTFYGADSNFTTPLTNVAPIVTTNAATAVAYYSATITGNIINNGGDTIQTKGICWSTNPTPTTADSVAYVTGTATTYSYTITTLLENKTYYARAFATSASGLGYGNIVSFTTKKMPSTYTISQVKGVNATTGVADSIGVNCKLTGIVTGINYSTNTLTSTSFYICESTAGINVYKAPNTLTYTVTQGDLVRVIGKIAQASGLTQIIPDSIVVISSGNTPYPAVVTTIVNEYYESRLIRMDNLTYLSGWPTTAGTVPASVKALNGTDTINIVIGRYCNLQGTPAPTIAFSVIGLESQYDNTSPYTSGYTIYPRDSFDIILSTGITTFEKPSFSVYPNPNNGNFRVMFTKYMDADVKIYSMIGSLIEQKTIKALNTEFDLSTYGKGMYMIQITDRKTGLSATEKLVVK